MNFINYLEEQSVFAFTGRVNILSIKNGEFLGAVLLKEGILVNSSFNNEIGETTLLRIFRKNLEKNVLKFIVEPEIISEKDVIFKKTVPLFKKEAENFYHSYMEAQRLRPARNLNLILESKFIIEGKAINFLEFEIMKVLVEYSTVEDIYKNMPYDELELTASLVSLRKKGAIKVQQA